MLDLSQVTGIDSTGLALLMRLQQRLQTNGTALVLIGLSPRLEQIFKRSHWEDFFACAADLPSAIHLLDARSREKKPVVNGPLSLSKRLFWRGEITAANIAEVWAPTQDFMRTAAVPAAELPNSNCGDECHSDTAAEVTVTHRTPAELVIDLSQVRFIDSSGLGLMVRVRKMAHRQAIALVFTGLQPAVRNVIHMARLEEFLKVRIPDAEPTLDLSLSPAPV